MYAMKGALLIVLSLMWLAPGPAVGPEPLKAGEDGQGPWWMKQTAIKRDGTMASLKTNPGGGKPEAESRREFHRRRRGPKPKIGCWSGASGSKSGREKRSRRSSG